MWSLSNICSFMSSPAYKSRTLRDPDSGKGFQTLLLPSSDWESDSDYELQRRQVDQEKPVQHQEPGLALCLQRTSACI